MTTKEEFYALARQGFNRIPLTAQAFADLETPLSLYLKLTADAPYSFLLESVVGGERFGRFSFIGLPARTLLRSSGFGAAARTEVLIDGVVVESAERDMASSVNVFRNTRLFSGLPSRLRRICRRHVNRARSRGRPRFPQ